MPFRPSVLRLLPLLGLTQCLMQGEGAYPTQPMPAATQTGANTAGCFVDGQLWVAHYYNTTIGASNPKPVYAWWNNASLGGPILSLSLLKDNADQTLVHHDTSMNIELPGITRAGTYVLDLRPSTRGRGPNGYASFTLRKPTPDQEFLTDAQHTGTLVVTRFDTISRVVSGTFAFTARHAATGTVVRVTEGRFDAAL